MKIQASSQEEFIQLEELAKEMGYHEGNHIVIENISLLGENTITITNHNILLGDNREYLPAGKHKRIHMLRFFIHNTDEEGYIRVEIEGFFDGKNVKIIYPKAYLGSQNSDRNYIMFQQLVPSSELAEHQKNKTKN